MNPDQIRPRWLRKRVWLPLILIAGVVVASVIAFLNSDASTIIVYNETGSSIGVLKVSACDQEAVQRSLAEQESFRMKLKEAGAPGEIELETATSPPWQWRGGYVETRGGYRVTIRLWPNGEVELHTQISLWQQLLRGAPSIDN
jgi:hypothetical protein